MKGEHHVYEEVDWSTTGPWNQHRRLFGLNEFAGFVTTLAMQRPGTDIRKRILPHHVFQLQCVVDSLTASRGWTLSFLRGHILTAPARKFFPRRDVDLFLDREVQRDGRGLLQSIDILKQLLQKDAELHKDPNRHKVYAELLGDFSFDFVNWLGKSDRHRESVRQSMRERQAVARDHANDIHKLFDVKFNQFFKQKSTLMAIPSLLYMIRLTQTKREVTADAAQIRLKETELIRRAKSKGRTDEELLEAASVALPPKEYDEANTQAIIGRIAELKDYKMGPRRDPFRVSEDKKQEQLQGGVLLDSLRADVFADVCGRDPVSGLNYVFITTHMMMLFMEFEDGLRKARHPLWVSAYEQPAPQLRLQKRVTMVVGAMADKDEDAMKIFAAAFQKLRIGAIGCLFWDDLREDENGLRVKAVEDDDPVPTHQCCVM
ncbi:hypothetical protein NX059_011967 [Plenodomus lindquistii]|nr:hypothetical protein NX059_011967 [Plenodomus lindquistii]